MAGNPLSGHTKANMTLSGSAQPADGLTDGDHILSPTLTNFLEGIHGNGILLEEDTAYGDGDRDDPENLPGACNQQTNSYTFRVQGGLAVLDGVLYAFADGPGNSTDIVISSSSSSKTGSPTALTSGQEALVVVYLSADDNAKHVYWEMGTAVTTASNTYPTTPSAFLNAPGSLTNRNTTVLATLRAVYSATGGDYKVSISEINDKRAFVRPSPIYFSPVTSGAVAATTAATNPDAFHSGDEAGSLAGSRVGALWQSYNADGDSLLYYSAKTDSSTRHTHVLGPSSVKALTPSSTTTFTYDESSIFVITPGSAHQFNPSGTFPKGHMVFVSNHAAHGTNGITFDNGGLGSVILGKESALFVYDGSNWKSVIFASGATSPNGHGATGMVQLSDGGGGFTSDTKLFWTTGTSTFTVNGKLTVTGLIDPTGVEFTAVGSNPGTDAAKTIWVNSGDSNKLYFGSSEVGGGAGTVTSVATTAPITGGTITGTGTIGISAATTGAAGSMSAADKTKLDGIAASATANDTDANLKNRSNHTGTQLAATISDFATAIAADPTVAANTAKQGFVNPLYLTAKVGTNTNDSGLTAGTWHKVEYWDTISSNTLALDSATDGEKFTVGSGQGGLYSIHAQVGWVSTNSTLPSSGTSPYQLLVAIYLNGSVLVRQGTATYGSPSAKTAPVSTEVVLADSDYVEIYFFVRKEDDTGNTGTQQLRGGEYCRWSVRRIGDS
jgi:hypothetical protein